MFSNKIIYFPLYIQCFYTPCVVESYAKSGAHVPTFCMRINLGFKINTSFFH